MIYTCSAANRASACSTLNQNGFLFFGSSNLISIANSHHDNPTVLKTLSAHRSDIVKLKGSRDIRYPYVTRDVDVVNGRAENYIASADALGVVHLWSGVDVSWSVSHTIQAHPSHSISAIAFSFPFLVTASSDGLVKLWDVETSTGTPLETLNIRETEGKIKNDDLVFVLDAELVFIEDASCDAKYLFLYLCLTTKIVAVYVYPLSSQRPVLSRALGLKGHSNWVTTIDFSFPPRAESDDEGLLFATGSHDTYIRLWRVRLKTVNASIDDVQPKDEGKLELEGLDILDKLGIDEGQDGEEEELDLKEQTYNLSDSLQLGILPYSVLSSHTSPITSLHFSPASSPLSLLSTSLDRSLILWSPTSSLTLASTSDTLWVPAQRFGTLETGTNLGFFGALWSISSYYTRVLASGWGGAWHVWGRRNDTEEETEWESLLGVGGHFGPVKGVAWEPEGEWLMSCSTDRTTRLHGIVDGVWREVARPQVHGWEIWATEWIGRDRFACAADEKIVRVFEDTKTWKKIRKDVLGLNVSLKEFDETKAKTASLPALGLSNKAETTQEVDEPTNKRIAPLEEELMSLTLWPEIDKIYGHGYELFSLSISRSGGIIATACKSTSPVHAVVRLFDSKSYKPFGEPLEGHTLTITRIRWSLDDKWILAVGRDRSWVIWEKDDDGTYKLLKRTQRAHGRILWDCDWYESKFFVTASRDKTVKTWESKKDEVGITDFTCTNTLKLDESANSVCLTSPIHGNRIIMAIGLESGTLLIYERISDDWKLSRTLQLTVPSSHSTINQIRFCPKRPRVDALRIALAVDDGTVRILDLELDPEL